MSATWSIRLQTALVILLFLGSLSTVLFAAFQTLTLPQRQVQTQDRLQEASRRMAEAAWMEGASQAADDPRSWAALNAWLRAISAQVLKDYRGVEGGFYVGGAMGRFAGYGFPTRELSPPPPEPRSTPKAKDRPAPPGPSLRGDDPPPNEADLILFHVRHSLTLSPGRYDFQVATVGPSRVAILTEPVGPERPARLATWTLFRLIDPAQQAAQLGRYQVATGLALGGMILAFVLTANLGRILRRQRADQERLREDLRRAEHLAALGKLLAGVAHEVRNPLAGIRSTVQLWQRLPEMARTPGSMEAVIRAVDQLNDIVSRLLYFARADAAERRPLDLNQVLRETLKLLEAQAATQGVLLELDLQASLPPVLGSAGALRQVFLNLATNALQAMPQGGRLRCRTRFPRSNRTVEIRFADTGPGVSPEDREHLFEPFFTTRPEGTGLGLAICHEIVHQHGGRIELDPGTGPGATFRVVLPVAP